MFPSKKNYGLVAGAPIALFILQTLAFAAAPPGQTGREKPVDPQSMLQAAGLKSQWDVGGFTLGGRYDSTLGAIAEARFSRSLADDWALGLIGEYGANNARINTTLGYQFNPTAQVKVTAEYLNQKLPFYFDSGRIDERVDQRSIGLQLRQNFDHSLFKNIQAGGYWSDAPGESLATVSFINSGGLSASNERHIAGSTSRGLNVGSDLDLGENTTLKATAMYDSIDYDTRLSTASFDRSGFGAALTLEQLLTERMKLSLKAENRPLIDSYGAQLQWLPESLPLSIALMSQRLVSNDQNPDSNVFGMTVGFALDGGVIQKASSKRSQMSDLKTWVQEPAVRMERVQVRSEQRTTVDSPSIGSLSVTSGSTTGGTSVTITGTNFTGATAVTFGGVAATAFTVVNATTITATAPVAADAGLVDVAVVTPQGTTTLGGGYTYNAAVIFVTATTSDGNLGGFAGADAICNADANRPGGFAAGYTYKAMLNGNNATRAGAGYYRSNGTTKIATATGGNLVDAASLLVSIETSLNVAWTGAGAGPTCNNWTSNGGGVFGNIGQTNFNFNGYWFFGFDSCSIPNKLYCVSQ